MVDDTRIALSDSVEFDISTSGAISSSTKIKDKGPNIGGAVIGGLVAGPAGAVVGGQKKLETKTETQDSRHLYLTVISDEANAVAEVDPDKELELRKLVAEAKHAIKTLEDREAKSAEAVMAAKKALNEAKANDEELKQATALYVKAKENTAAKDKAIADYDALVASVEPKELRREEMAQLLNGAKFAIKLAYMVFAFLFGLLFVVVGYELLVGSDASVGANAFAALIVLLLADVLLMSAVIILRDNFLSKMKKPSGAERGKSNA